MSAPSEISFETRFPITLNSIEFPFKCELSLMPLIDIWKQAAFADRPITAMLHRQVVNEARKVPELLNPIDDLSLLDRHRELIDVLMTEVFPPASWANDYAAAMFPFQLRTFYATPAFEGLLSDAAGGVRGRINLDPNTVASARMLNAYSLILRKYYGIELGFDYPIIVTTQDPETRLDRHFRVHFDRQFLEVESVGEFKQLSDDERRHLLANLVNPAVLLAVVPPHGFLFRGFWVLKATDVTEQEVLSSLKRDLIERDSVASPAQFHNLQTGLRTLLHRPALQLTLAATHGDQVLMLHEDNCAAANCIFADTEHQRIQDFAASIYERAIAEARPQVIEDLAVQTPRSPREESLLASGARAMVVAPLYYRRELTGWLELKSPRPGDLDAMRVIKLREILPIFSIALRRALEELNNRIEAIIKANCTAIHPSVAWRFRQAALRSISGGAREAAGMEAIVFRNVYPLFASADIRDSSIHRSLAIQADLIARLRLAREVVQAAYEDSHLPILDELKRRITRRIEQVELTLNSGDELTILRFLSEHVESLFRYFEQFGPAVRDRVRAYRSTIAARDGAVCQNRRAYEDSITQINETISSYLDDEQKKAQAICPHYFEKECTDGVSYTIYVGASLTENGDFNELYLKNLRLWQLFASCDIARRLEALRERLRVPLQVTHLILIHGARLDIRFLADEKRFGVDGAYNMRYEVIKKRIDKAVVKGTAERITQPGKIAIVYSDPGEAAVYRDYIDYLLARDYLTGAVEDLELDELQGVHGLRALRVTVKSVELDLTGDAE
jgi:hypothetical protein